MRTIQCPQCNEPCITVQYGTVEIDCCMSCSGIWLDRGELEALVGDPVPVEKADPELGPPDRDCPICVDQLIKERYGRTSVVVDKCPHGDGVWLDEGELQAILAAYASGSADAAGHDDQAAGALTDFFSNHPTDDAGGASAPPSGKTPN
ncbi:MAG: zf-TFIIB domain-containing protein [Candidatus Brocadiae bacterium]|nr:zf-TFIIB domain-containing protein [Candidatus Brocadiia bacterium]